VRRHLIFAAFLSFAAIFTAHAANGLVWRELVLPPDPSSSGVEKAPATTAPMSQDGLVELISESAIFAAEIPPGAVPMLTSSGPAGTVAAIRIEAAKKVKVMGTVIRDGRGVLAVLQDLATKKQKGYRPHDNVPGLGEIAEIRRDGVVFHEGGQWELLRLPAAMPAAINRATDPAGDEFPNYRLLERALLTRVAADPAILQSQYRVVPVSSGGRGEGLRVEAYKVDGLFVRLGLQPGDVLRRLNGVSLTDANVLLSLLFQLPREETFTLDLVRRGQPVTFNYEIR
jgi:general secretion pathway protein C